MPEDLKTAQLALHGGAPVRAELLPYGRHEIDDDDVAAVDARAAIGLADERADGRRVRGARSRASVGAPHAVAVSSGTAALHAAMFAIGIGPGDEVIVPPMTFAASANAVVYQGGTPVFADVDADTLLIDPAKVAATITPKTRAIVAVDYGGQPCDYDALRAAIGDRPIAIVADACHALGARERGRPVGTLADLSVVQPAPGEARDDRRRRRDRDRGSGDGRAHADVPQPRHHDRSPAAQRAVVVGLRDRRARLQLPAHRHPVRARPQPAGEAAGADRAAAGDRRRVRPRVRVDPEVSPLALRPGVSHAYHLYVVRVDTSTLACDRATLFGALRREGIGVNVHYIPVHLHPFYRQRFGFGPGLCPVAEAAYEQLITLPMFPAMTARDVQDVIEAVTKVVTAFRP